MFEDYSLEFDIGNNVFIVHMFKVLLLVNSYFKFRIKVNEIIIWFPEDA